MRNHTFLATLLATLALFTADVASAEPPNLSAAVLSDGGGGFVDRLSGPELPWVAGASVVAIPAAFFAARFVGSLSNDIVGAAVPALLTFALLPPALAAGAGWWSGQPSARFLPAFLVGTGLQVLAFGALFLLEISRVTPVALAVFSLVDAALLTGVTLAAHEYFPAPTGSGGDAIVRHAEADLRSLPMLHAR